MKNSSYRYHPKIQPLAWAHGAGSPLTLINLFGWLATRFGRNPPTRRVGDWVAPPLPNPPSGLSRFEGNASPELYEIYLQLATYCVTPLGDRVSMMYPQSAYNDVSDNPEESDAKIREDSPMGRLLVFTERSDPYAGNMMESKLAYVTQRDVNNPKTPRPDILAIIVTRSTIGVTAPDNLNA